MEAVYVSIEPDDPQGLPALVEPGVHWNGWEIPWFTRATALQLLNDLDVEYHEEDDGEIVIGDYDLGGMDLDITCRWIDGVQYYNIGDGWTWCVTTSRSSAAVAA